jgi:hypothetical protein
MTCAACGLLLCSPALAVVTTFDNGLEGWSISGRTTILPTGGNPGANLGPLVTDVFGIDIRNNTNAAFLGNYSQFWQTNGGGPGAPLRLSIDTKTNSIDFFGSQVSRNLIVELRDYTNPPPNYPYVSVWYNLGTIAASLPGWRTFSIDIVNPNSTTLPSGWGGTGDEDPQANPRLPANRTFASVLAGVDEISFTTFQPGFFYGFTNFNVQVDNPTLTVVPSPATLAAPAILLACARRRRR